MDRLQDISGKLISVIVPIYKAEASISSCIESIVNQDHNHIQLLLINDGSPDKSGAICDEYAQRDNRITVIHSDNQGVSSARNQGIELASGEYIAFVDSDDTIDSGFLSTAVSSIEAYNADIFLSGMRMKIYNRDTLLDKVDYKGETKLYSVKELFEASNVEYPFICICGPTCKLYRTEIINTNNIRFDVSMSFGEDTVFNCEYLEHVQDAYFSERIFYNYYRGNQDSLFSRYTPNLFSINVKIYDQMRLLMMDVNCSNQTMKRFDALYGRILIGCIFHEFIFFSKSNRTSRFETIIKVSRNPYVRKYPFSECKNLKDYLVLALLKCRMHRSIFALFTLYYGMLPVNEIKKS